VLDQIICALDTSDLAVATKTVQRLAPSIKHFKVGHSLTLAHSLSVIATLRDAGAERIFLDLKFHDIPNTVAGAVREAAKYGVWMTTLHTVGGADMMKAAADVPDRPLLMGVSVLTSLDEVSLAQIGVSRTVEDQMSRMSALAIKCGIDGVISSPLEVTLLRSELGAKPLIVTPGIRLPGGESHDQKRFATPQQALADGASYLVIGRALSEAEDLDFVIDQLK
jgi:orotidine-5'-phosphate decarboxylase